MAKRKVLSRGMNLERNLESSQALQNESKETQMEYKRFTEIGEKFEEDRAELDRTIEAVEMSNATKEYKEKAREKYEYAVELLKRKYDKEVKEAEDELEKEMIEQERIARESSAEHARVEAEVSKSKFEVSGIDMSEAAKMAGQESQELANIEKANAEQRRLLKEQADMQRRRVFVERLRGRK